MSPPKVRNAPEVIVFEDPDAKVRQRSRVNPRGEDVCVERENEHVEGKEQ